MCDIQIVCICIPLCVCGGDGGVGGGGGGGGASASFFGKSVVSKQRIEYIFFTAKVLNFVIFHKATPN